VGGARGFTLIEVLIAVAVVAMVTVGAVGATMGARSLAVSTTAAHFDALLDAARTTAREYDGGVTIVFEPDAYGDGFTARVYGRRPSVGPLLTTDVPILDGRVTLTETELLGTPAFALAMHANGKVGGIRGNVLAGAAGAENACPAAGMYTLVFRYGGATAQRTIPCTIALVATGPVAYVNPPAASPLPPPTPNACITSGCIPTPPPEPTVITTCPPGYLATSQTSCAPITPQPTSVPIATCPPGYSGTYPDCINNGSEPTPSPSPLAETATTTISINVCSIPGGPGPTSSTTSIITVAQFVAQYAPPNFPTTTFSPYSYAAIVAMGPSTLIDLTAVFEVRYQQNPGPICV
jgi:prepilin-type N-terminal cleavage/methylation domain-containing protein